MTLNGEMALIWRYFTKFSNFEVHCVKVVGKAITMDNLRLLSSSKRLQRVRATPKVQIFYNCKEEIM